MKIAIVTIVDMINYGNRLQNYAMQEVLKQVGVEEVDTLIAFSAKRKGINIVKNIIRIINPQWIYKVRPYSKRERLFESFSSDKINQREIITINGKIPARLAKEYDYFILGSDQIWNPEFMNYDVPNAGAYNRFLKFASKRQRIAVAPSFGVSSISNEWKSTVKDGLSGFAELSVRESAGSEIISQLTNRSVQILLDPTMILDVEQWRRFEKKVDVDTDKPYVLKYILGHQSNSYREKIEQIAQKKGFVIYEMLTGNMEALLTATPDQFVYLIDHASLICTDSFHATVFSIIFNKPFLLHSREDELESMNSRLETLLKTLKLEYKLYTEEVNLWDCDYVEAHKIIARERETFINYLKKALLGESV